MTKVHEHGHVELAYHTPEPVLKVVNAAKVSYAKAATEFGPKEQKLLAYLIEHGHTSPLRHVHFTFRIKAPLFVFRQWWTYTVDSEFEHVEKPSSWNEQSGRYTEFTPEFYVPTVLRFQDSKNKQGSGVEHYKSDRYLDEMQEYQLNAMALYHDMIDDGVSREQARLVLPPTIYSECIWTCSLQTVLHFLAQRTKPEAQEEIRDYANAVRDLLKPVLGDLV